VTASIDPALSVVVVTRDHLGTLRPIIRSLENQSIAGRIELVIVAPAETTGVPPSDAFHSVRIVPVGPVTNRGRAAAAGVRQARAPVVALTENHCFPPPEWAERLLASHAAGRSAVGPAVLNGNPESTLSQAMHAFGYGRFHPSGAPGPIDELPLHNSSYRSDVLQRAALEEELGDERVLQRELRARGEILHFDPTVVKSHLNEATWALVGAMCYYGGRRYGGTRSLGWPTWRRAFYGAAAPLLSLPIARNIWKKLPPPSELPRGLGLVAVVWVGALMHAIGEGASYLLGPRVDFPVVESDEFLIRERLGGRPLTRPDLAALVALLDDEGGRK
jgi:hypothetical protein